MALLNLSFPGKTIAFLIVLSTLMIPFQILLIPLYILVYNLGWTNNYAGLIIPGALSARRFLDAPVLPDAAG